MVHISRGVSTGYRWAILLLTAAVTILAISTDSAEARRKYRQSAKSQTTKSQTAKSSYSPPSAAIVVDGNSGKVLHGSNADNLRHPASLTKIMTLYLLFERLEAGKVKLDTAMDVSERASSQAPTKLGLKPGQTIEVEDAIKALVTKSANDAAVVIAEAIAGDEDSFATLMTKKARALGMSRTVYKNASGLPDDEQVTTAREQALLGRAVQERFPRYYKYFATSSFRYRGNAMRNHNRLLGRVEGVDGIKTGYTQASGFNLVTSVHRGGRYLIAVVLGGRSASSRDATMRQLIEAKIAGAATQRTTTAIADAGDQPGASNKPAAVEVATAGPVLTPQAMAKRLDSAPTATVPSARPAPGSNDPLKPVLVKTVTVKSGTVHAAGTSSAPATPGAAPTTIDQVIAASMGTPDAPSAAPPPAKPGTLGVLPAQLVATTHDDIAVSTSRTPEQPAASTSRPSNARGGWAIQIGAYEAEDEAKQHLSAAQSKAKTMLARADAYTERVTKGEKTYYRARFAGFDKDAAEAACKQLKRNEIACMALKN